MTDLTRKVINVSAEVISMTNEGQAGAHDGVEHIRDHSNCD